MKDDIVEQMRQVREELIERHGGIDGYFKYCQGQEKALAARRKQRRGRKKASATRKTAKAQNSNRVDLFEGTS
jgi:hypothetical protein